MFVIEHDKKHYLASDLVSALVMTHKLPENAWEITATPRQGKTITFVMASDSGDAAIEFIKKKMTEHGNPPIVISFVNVGRSRSGHEGG